MASIKQAAYNTIAIAISTGLNSLASAGQAISAAIDNSTDLAIWDDLELVATFGTAPTAGSTVDVYLIPSVDDTNYADASSSIAPATMLQVGAFEVRAVTTEQRMAVRNVPIPPGSFKYLVVNNTGQAMASSGNTLKRRPHAMSSV